MSSQGQLTIPKPAREAAGLDDGLVMVLVDRAHGFVLLTPPPKSDDALQDLASKAPKKRQAT